MELSAAVRPRGACAGPRPSPPGRRWQALTATRPLLSQAARACSLKKGVLSSPEHVSMLARLSSSGHPMGNVLAPRDAQSRPVRRRGAWLPQGPSWCGVRTNTGTAGADCTCGHVCSPTAPRARCQGVPLCLSAHSAGNVSYFCSFLTFAWRL